jgi:hypothetical protein
MRKHFRHDWLIERATYADGDMNIIWGFAYVELQWPPKFSCLRFRQDGLPIRRFDLGPIRVGWGQTHEWFCFDKED